jgi:hypothetical protein
MHRNVHRNLGVRWLLIGGLLLVAAGGAGATLYRAAAQQAAAPPTIEKVGAPVARVAREGGSAEPLLAEAAAQFEQALARDPANQEAYRLLAQTHQMRGDTPAALATWQRATTANPRAQWAWRGLARAAQEAHDDALAGEALSTAAALLGGTAGNTQLAAELAAEIASVQHAAVRRQRIQAYWAAAAPATGTATFTPVDQSLDQTWTLVGYFADSAALVRGEPTPVWLAWEAADGRGELPAGATWEPIGDGLWLQAAGVLRNLVGDGSFDTAGGRGATNFFSGELYGADPSTRQVRSAVRGGEESYTAVLANGLGNPDTSYVSQPIPITEGAVYLQSGAVRSVAGNAFLGRRWLDAGGAAVEEYLVTGEAGGVWRETVQVAAPPEGATAVEVLLLNRSTTGTAYFDDLLLLPIARPPDATE